MAWGYGNLGTASVLFLGMITVTYPSNSALTVTSQNGGEYEEYVISATKSAFYVKNFDTYTFTSRTTSGASQSAAKSVTISTAGLCSSITIAYSLILYNRGTTETAISGGNAYKTVNGGTLSRETSSLKFKGTMTTSKVVLYTKNKINLTDFKSMVVEYKLASGMVITFGAASSINTDAATANWNKSTAASSASGSKTVTLDISSVTASCYPAVYIKQSGESFVYSIKLLA